METTMKLLAYIGCLRKGHQPAFVRNVYGDEIVALGNARSIFKCTHCGRTLYQGHLAEQHLVRLSPGEYRGARIAMAVVLPPHLLTQLPSGPGTVVLDDGTTVHVTD
jgi:hypothetical protein